MKFTIKISLVLIILPILSYSQVNRYSTYEPARYEPLSFQELYRMYERNNRSQEISCSDLYKFVVKNGYKKGTVPSYTMNSSWLKTVTAYEYDNIIFVVAEIKVDEYSYKTNSYIFCGIPFYNWNNFRNGISESYGERFHKYIFDYKCDCN